MGCLAWGLRAYVCLLSSNRHLFLVFCTFRRDGSRFLHSSPPIATWLRIERPRIVAPPSFAWDVPAVSPPVLPQAFWTCVLYLPDSYGCCRREEHTRDARKAIRTEYITPCKELTSVTTAVNYGTACLFSLAGFGARGLEAQRTPPWLCVPPVALFR